MIERVIGNLEDWSLIVRGTSFRTEYGARFRRLECGHFRNEDAYDAKIEGGPRSDDWCWNGCHLQLEEADEWSQPDKTTNGSHEPSTKPTSDSRRATATKRGTTRASRGKNSTKD